MRQHLTRTGQKSLSLSTSVEQHDKAISTI
ncbi:hypothetical protein FOT68_01155 [Citrobacter braakii]|nr:hypothetical protein [Citrobacter braakii]